MRLQDLSDDALMRLVGICSTHGVIGSTPRDAGMAAQCAAIGVSLEDVDEAAVFIEYGRRRRLASTGRLSVGAVMERRRAYDRNDSLRAGTLLEVAA